MENVQNIINAADANVIRLAAEERAKKAREEAARQCITELSSHIGPAAANNCAGLDIEISHILKTYWDDCKVGSSIYSTLFTGLSNLGFTVETEVKERKVLFFFTKTEYWLSIRW